MFVAWRDLRFARGRFALVLAVVGLITMLVVLLSGLTQGLGRDSTSAVTGLAADRVVLAHGGPGEAVTFATSSLDAGRVDGWKSAPGVQSVAPLGISTTPGKGSRTATVTTIGVPGDSKLAAGRTVAAGSVVLSTGAAESLCGDEPCRTVQVAGQDLEVAAVSGDASYSHMPVVWMELSDWHGLPGAAGRTTALAVDVADSVDLAALDAKLSTVSHTPQEARVAVPSYSSENGSLQMMRALLFGISALVVGAFFTVWSMQRTGDVAVLKALGASTAYVLRDAVAQSAIVLALGVGAGALVATGLGLAARNTVPLVLDAQTLLVPALITVALGLAGAALSVLRVARVDPLIALGASR